MSELNKSLTTEFLIEQLELLASKFSERRSDVEEMVADILDGVSIKDFQPEHRFAKFDIPNYGVVEYDTLTTLLWSSQLEYDLDGEYTD